MAKKKFIYNKHTLQYEEYVRSLREKLVSAFRYFSVTIVSSVAMLALLYTFFPSPREKSLLDEIKALEVEFDGVTKRTELLADQLTVLQKRDAEVHRTIFGMNPLPMNIYRDGINMQSGIDNAKLKHSSFTVNNLRNLLDNMDGRMAVQTRSLDTLIQLARNKETMLSSLPSIKPVREDKLNRDISLLSGFGWRIHPIHKVKKFHKGIDFAAPQGTPIQTTGDGVVVKVEHSRGGYGNSVVIDHGFGYKTLYGHMNTINVTVGQKLKKGQQIGAVGSTGTSTAPHLHYEVHLKDEAVDPLQYCLDGLTPMEYQEMVDASQRANQSFD
jgi:Peptidase family M23